MNEAVAITAAILTLIGGLLGAIGASSLRWKTKKVDKKSLTADQKREIIRDRFTLGGWSAVIVGAIFALIAITTAS